MRKKLILFDLDGTLLDTEEGITKSIQYALRYMGREEEDLKKLRRFIGPPLREKFIEIFGFSQEQAEVMLSAYRKRYALHGKYESRLYPDVALVLDSLKKKGYMLALASSKNLTACMELLRHFDIDGFFDYIGGATDDGKISKKADVLKMTLERLGVEDVNQCILVGDTQYDAWGAQELGMDCLGVSYGFGAREELEKAGVVGIVNNMREVEAYFED